MRGVRFLVLLIIAIPLAWYAYRDSKKPPDEGVKHDKVFAVEADKIDEITIKSESGDRTTLKRKGTSWEIAEPAPGPVDEAAVSGITSNLSSADIQRVVDEAPADLAEYGLKEPRVEVAFKSGGQERRLQLGGKTPTGTDIYAKLADQKQVFLISSFLDSTFNRGTFDLRDKTVLKLDMEKIDALDVATPQRTLRFEKKNGEWQIAQPALGTADFGAVTGLLGRIGNTQMKALAPATADAKALGLETPAVTVRIGTGSSQATLVVGGPAAEGTVYARDLSRPQVFTIESSLLDDLKKDVSEYRQKDLFDARSFNATRVEIARAGQTLAFEKTTVKGKDGKDEEKWRQLSPAARDVDATKMEALISAITAARATGFVDSAANTGLDKPELTVAIWYDQGKQDRVSFSRNADKAYAARTGSPGAATIDASAIDAIAKALEGVK